MKSIKELKNISGKRILLRVDFNVPIKDGKILDDFRIKKSIPTIEFLRKKGAILIIVAHLGEGKESLMPVYQRLKKFLPNCFFLNSGILSNDTEDSIKKLKKGDIVLLENIRGEIGEKKNSPSFSRALSRYADIYVNDAFSVSHRAHASVVGINKYLKGYAGFQMSKEVDNLLRVFKPAHPFLFVLGGAKFETKMPLIKKFLRLADNVFIGGALANDFFKIKGCEIGKSLVDSGNFKLDFLLKNSKLILPIDVEVIDNSKKRFASPSEVKKDEMIVDVGPNSIKMLETIIKKSKFILWNGPLGKYEDNFGGGTEKILRIISKSKAHSIIGGGDTVSIISKLNLEDKMGFVSTGGGATLEFLTKGTLPGIKALK